MPASRRTWLAPPALLLVALPWLNPSAVGPSPAGVPCAGIIWY